MNKININLIIKWVGMIRFHAKGNVEITRLCDKIITKIKEVNHE